MSPTDLKMRLAMVMATLGEGKGMEPFPASLVYLAMDSSMSDYNALTSVGVRMGWLRVTSETVALTSAGLVIARKFAAAMVGECACGDCEQ